MHQLSTPKSTQIALKQNTIRFMDSFSLKSNGKWRQMAVGEQQTENGPCFPFHKSVLQSIARLWLCKWARSGLCMDLLKSLLKLLLLFYLFTLFIYICWNFRSNWKKFSSWPLAFIWFIFADSILFKLKWKWKWKWKRQQKSTLVFEKPTLKQKHKKKRH